MDLLKKGTILCNNSKCNAKMDLNTGTCPKCGNTHCYITLYWKGQHYKRRRDDAGNILSVLEAINVLSGMNTSIRHSPDTFNPKTWVDEAVQERKFENQWDKFIVEYEERLKEDECSPEYVRVLKTYRRKWFVVLEGSDVTLIELGQLAKIKQAMKGKKPKTKANVINALVHFFNWLKKNGVIKAIPEFPEVDASRMTPQRAIDTDAQLEALERIPQPYRDVIEFGMELGLRPGETCALKVKDIDQRTGLILIARTWSGATLRGTTKGGTEDWLPMSERACEIAVQHCKDKHPEAWLFVNPRTKGPFRRKRLGEIWNQYADLPVKHYEASRHTFCTTIVESGASEMETQMLMRHKDPRTTKKYFHGRAERLRGFMNRRRGTGNVIPIKEKDEDTLSKK